MKSTLFFASVLTSSLLFFTACQPESVPAQPSLPYQSDFQNNSDGWTADIVDYSTEQDNIMEFKSARTSLPTPLDGNRQSLMLESMNRSDDAFMFLKRKVTGLQPNTDYSMTFEIELASQYASNSVGVGGSPGGSVYLKAGATSIEPIKQLNNNFYSLNIDKGAQIADGKDAITLGHIGTGDDVTGYKLITRSNANKPFTARTNDKGELWLLVGTDSGFEGLTTLYYSSIKVITKAIQ